MINSEFKIKRPGATGLVLVLREDLPAGGTGPDEEPRGGSSGALMQHLWTPSNLQHAKRHIRTKRDADLEKLSNDRQRGINIYRFSSDHTDDFIGWILYVSVLRLKMNTDLWRSVSRWSGWDLFTTKTGIRTTKRRTGGQNTMMRGDTVLSVFKDWWRIQRPAPVASPHWHLQLALSSRIISEPAG